MKKALSLLSLAILMFACSNTDNKTDKSEKLSNFLSTFKTLQLPLSSEQIKQQGTIENEFLDILTDTTGGFSRNYPDGEIHFTDEYYYIGKIETENKNFQIIIAAKTPTAAVQGLMEGALLEAQLYTISLDGKIISEIPFAYYSEGANWGMTALVNENLEIETKLDKTIKKYKIEKDGKIIVVSETTEEGNNEFEHFIAEGFKPEVSIFNSDRFRMIDQRISDDQLIFIGNEYIPNTDELTIYRPVVFEMPNYTVILLTYRDYANELANLITVDKTGKIISQKEEIYYFGERAKSGFIEIEPLEDNTILVTSKRVDAKKFGNGIGLTTTSNYYKIDQNGKLTEAEPPLTFTDDRDGKTYKMKNIGGEIWMVENFAYKPQNGKYGDMDGNYWAYDDKEANVEKYGYLYDWATAQEIIPDGWHLPTKEEFESLIKYYGENPFNPLTEELDIVYSGWYYGESMIFAHEANEAGFWSATEQDKDNAWLCILEREYEHVIIRTRFKEGVGASIRLVMDEEVL